VSHPVYRISLYTYVFYTQSVLGHLSTVVGSKAYSNSIVVVVVVVVDYSASPAAALVPSFRRRCRGAPDAIIRERIHRRRGREGAFSHPFDIKRRLNEALFPGPTHPRCRQTVSSRRRRPNLTTIVQLLGLQRAV